MKEVRLAVIRLFQEGRSKAEISRLLQVPETTVRRDIKRYQETGSNNDRAGRGRKRTANTAVNRRKIRQRIQTNPRRSARKLAKDIGMRRESTRLILTNELKKKPYKMREAHLLTDAMKTMRLERCNILQARFSRGRHRSILFSDEKLFTIEQSHNNQNDRIWTSESPLESGIVSRSQKPKSVMVWAGITHNGKSPLIFIDEGIKVNQGVYRSMLEEQVLPWTQTHFGEAKWTFRQDSARRTRLQKHRNGSG